MLFKELIKGIVNEQNIDKGRKNKTLVNAITNRHPITFYYKGNSNSLNDFVKPGVRIRAEVVAMGLSRKGNVLIRAYVQPPSVSKKGFDKTNWRTFRIDRMSNIRVLEDEVFTEKRPGYNPNDESPGSPMVRTLVKSVWTDKPEPTKKPETKSEPEVEPKVQPEPQIEPDNEPLPEPIPIEKPPVSPEDEKPNYVDQLSNKVSPREVNGQKYITTDDFERLSKELYKTQEKDWMDKQKNDNLNTKAGEGTRRKFEMDTKSDLSKFLVKNNIKVTNNIPNQEENNNELQESILRIKSLMFG